MTVATETQTKFEVDAADFEKLKGSARLTLCVDQLNVYYDRAGRLAGQSVTFRVRFSRSEPPVLTLKVPTAISREHREMKEYQYRLRAKPRMRSLAQYREIDVDSELPPDASAALLALGVNRLERVGWIRNRRYHLEVTGIGMVDLDKLELPDGATVYEAEIESGDGATRERLAAWIRSHAPEARPSLISKYQRFRGALLRRPAHPNVACE